jgi:aspartyl aminopeptidase
VQKFIVRSDLGCGSTIGPITAANLGIRTVDVGNPMLSMHSIREMAGTKDHESLTLTFKEYFKP